jgi:hypothetical protein
VCVVCVLSQSEGTSGSALCILVDLDASLTIIMYRNAPLNALNMISDQNSRTLVGL